MAIEIKDVSSEASRSKCACGMPANKIIVHESRYIPMCRSCFVQLQQKMKEAY